MENALTRLKSKLSRIVTWPVKRLKRRNELDDLPEDPESNKVKKRLRGCKLVEDKKARDHFKK